MEYTCYCQLFDRITQQNPPELDLIGTFFSISNLLILWVVVNESEAWYVV